MHHFSWWQHSKRAGSEEDLFRSGSCFWKRAFPSDVIIEVCVSVSYLIVHGAVLGRRERLPWRDWNKGRRKTELGSAWKEVSGGVLALLTAGLMLGGGKNSMVQAGRPHSCKEGADLNPALALEFDLWQVTSLLAQLPPSETLHRTRKANRLMCALSAFPST